MNPGEFACAVAAWCFLFDGVPTGRRDTITRRSWFESFFESPGSRPMRATITYTHPPLPKLRTAWARKLGLVVRSLGDADEIIGPGELQV